MFLEQYPGNQVGPVSTSTPVTPTCSAPPFSTVGWSITRDTTVSHPAHPHPSLKPLESYWKVWNCGTGSTYACFTAFSTHKVHTKIDLPQSRNLLLALKKFLDFPRLLFLQNIISHLQHKSNIRDWQHMVQYWFSAALCWWNEKMSPHFLNAVPNQP